MHYRDVIDDYVAKEKPLRPYELSQDDWDSIELVTTFLRTFRAGTTQMSATKKPMLSTTHAIFKGLQDDIKRFIRDFPISAHPHLLAALVGSHRKLSDYFYKFDLSPYYIWSICMCL